MPGFAELALAGAPIAGGALLGVVAGNLRPPDLRGTIKKDMELLESLPPEDTQRRAEMQRVIDLRIDDIIAGIDKSRSMREIAVSYQGNWRDIVLFLCAVLFTIVWWNVSHARTIPRPAYSPAATEAITITMNISSQFERLCGTFHQTIVKRMPHTNSTMSRQLP